MKQLPRYRSVRIPSPFWATRRTERPCDKNPERAIASRFAPREVHSDGQQPKTYISIFMRTLKRFPCLRSTANFRKLLWRRRMGTSVQQYRSRRYVRLELSFARGHFDSPSVGAAVRPPSNSSDSPWKSCRRITHRRAERLEARIFRGANSIPSHYDIGF